MAQAWVIGIGMALAGILPAGEAVAETDPYKIYLASYEVAEQVAGCSGPGEQAVIAHLVAKDVEVLFDTYGYDGRPICGVRMLKGGNETSETLFNCDTDAKLTDSSYPRPTEGQSARVDLSAEAQICLRPFSSDVRLTGPMEVTSQNPDISSPATIKEAEITAWIPGREGYGDGNHIPLSADKRTAFVTLVLHCIAGPVTTGPLTYAKSTEVRFRLVNDLPAACKDESCAEHSVHYAKARYDSFVRCPIPSDQP